MENASKALLMAGGILIALLLIVLLIKSYGSISSFQNARLTAEEQEELLSFNEQYTKYTGQYVYGTEVITVINKSLNNKSHGIRTEIKFIDDNTNEGTYNGYVYNETTKRYDKAEINFKKGETLVIENNKDNSETVKDFINTLKQSGDINKMAFKCTNIGYDSYGRVNSIRFEEQKWGDLW